jgi:hypothetical protein
MPPPPVPASGPCPAKYARRPFDGSSTSSLPRSGYVEQGFPGFSKECLWDKKVAAAVTETLVGERKTVQTSELRVDELVEPNLSPDAVFDCVTGSAQGNDEGLVKIWTRSTKTSGRVMEMSGGLAAVEACARLAHRDLRERRGLDLPDSKM